MLLALAPVHLNCSWCKFLLLVWAVGHKQHLLLRVLLIPSALPSAAVSAEGLLMQFHVEVPALAGLDAVSAVLCAACLVPLHLNSSWCQFLLWGSVPVLVHEQHLLLRLVLLLLLLLLM